MRTDMQDIEYAIRGIDYPKNKNEIIDIAKHNNASDPVIQDLQSLPDKTYNDIGDLFKELTGKSGGLVQEERAHYHGGKKDR